jgi:hypothetical protein
MSAVFSGSASSRNCSRKQRSGWRVLSSISPGSDDSPRQSAARDAAASVVVAAHLRGRRRGVRWHRGRPGRLAGCPPDRCGAACRQRDSDRALDPDLRPGRGRDVRERHNDVLTAGAGLPRARQQESASRPYRNGLNGARPSRRARRSAFPGVQGPCRISDCKAGQRRGNRSNDGSRRPPPETYRPTAALLQDVLAICRLSGPRRGLCTPPFAVVVAAHFAKITSASLGAACNNGRSPAPGAEGRSCSAVSRSSTGVPASAARRAG